MNTHSIARAARISEATVEHLLAGVSRDELDIYIAIDYNITPFTTQAANARMNALGMLRASGYRITREHATYKLTGYEKPQAPKPVHVDTSAFDGLEQVALEDEQWVRPSLARRDVRAHETSWLYIMSYELARDCGYVYDHSALVIQRNIQRPHIRVFALDETPDALLACAQRFTPASVTPIAITNLTHETAQRIASQSRARVTRRRQAVYDTHAIATNPRNYFSRAEYALIRKHESTLTYRWGTLANKDAQTRVIDTWKQTCGPKQRQLALTRDYVAVHTQTLTKDTLIAFRDGNPCAVRIIDVPPPGDIAYDIVEKGLNYREQPGGMSGTSNWSIFATCRYLDAQGVRWFNVGAIDGGERGLALHKERFLDHVVYTYSATLAR